MAATLTVDVLSVNAGLPRHLGTRQGRPVESGIHKHPVDAGELRLDSTNLEGDRQADLTVHGGPDKALYVYPAEHLAAWTQELGAAGHAVEGRFHPGAIGENLTVAGWDEERAWIGDVWRWGDALVQIAQPRSPCFKLGLRTGVPAILRLFEETGRCGWYLRVLRPGRVPAGAPLTLEVVERAAAALSVRAAQRLARGRPEREALLRGLEHPALAVSWRLHLQDRLDLVDGRDVA
jgi:MOSC domain-containing protein YiiM